VKILKYNSTWRQRTQHRYDTMEQKWVGTLHRSTSRVSCKWLQAIHKNQCYSWYQKKVPGIQNKAGATCCRKQDLHKSRQLDRLCTSKYDLQPVNHTTWPGGGIIQYGIGLFFKTFSRSIDQSV